MTQMTLGHAFATSLKEHGYGWALCEPEDFSVLNPGSCGYINECGSWTPLFCIDDPDDLKRHGLGPIAAFQKAPSSERAWGPKTSSNTKQCKLELSGEAEQVDVLKDSLKQC